MIFDTRIHGIPCKCQVLYAECVARQYIDFVFAVLDRKGYAAPWLAKYISKQDIVRLQKEYESK